MKEAKEGEVRTGRGIEFQMAGATHLKAQEPKLVLDEAVFRYYVRSALDKMKLCVGIEVDLFHQLKQR